MIVNMATVTVNTHTIIASNPVTCRADLGHCKFKAVKTLKIHHAVLYLFFLHWFGTHMYVENSTNF